jgi:SAM-dependent methyltransferase
VKAVFGPAYAEAYDRLYDDKHYAAECDLIEQIFRRHGNGRVRRILDLGCGTGSHALVLGRRGYDVVGVDRSGSMLAQAQRKSDKAAVTGRMAFCVGDIRTIDLQQGFDAVLMMFAVLGYQIHDAHVLAALRTARRHLRAGGLLLFDVWYGPAVLAQGASRRLKRLRTPEGHLLRAASGELDVRRQICRVSYRLQRWQDKRLLKETRESHAMRYFFPRELESFLGRSGFACRRLGAFPKPEQDPSELTWNVLCIAEAV